MRRPRGTSSLAAPALLAVALLAPAVARGESPQQEYSRTGTVNACNHTAGELNAPVPNDVAQYAPDYQAALQAAARNRGSCGGSSGGATANRDGAGGAAAGGTGPDGRPLGANGQPTAKPPVPPARASAPPVPHAPSRAALSDASGDGGGGTPLVLVVLAGLAGLGLVAGALAAMARSWGWSPGRLDPARHAFAEARERTAMAAAGVGDLLRAPAARRG
jgi:hypothetical protein